MSKCHLKTLSIEKWFINQFTEDQKKSMFNINFNYK